MASTYGEKRGMVCAGCGLKYDAFRSGWSFLDARQTIIAIQTDRKTGKTKYGRRHGVLGFMHEQKMLAWNGHIGLCEAAAIDEGRLEAP